MKNFYFGVVIKEDGKHYSYVVKATSNDNLLSKLKIKNVVAINIFETKKRAEEVVTMWNNSYRANGTYMFDSPSF